MGLSYYCCGSGGAESDMELDLLGDSDSDSDESAHSRADNASIQRSAITAATAGSDAGECQHELLKSVSFLGISIKKRGIFCGRSLYELSPFRWSRLCFK